MFLSVNRSISFFTKRRMIIDSHAICILLHVVMNCAVKISNKYIVELAIQIHYVIVVNIYRRLRRNLPIIIGLISTDVKFFL